MNFNETNTNLTEFQKFYYSNTTDAREWLWNIADTAWGNADAETLEVVDDCEKNWMVNWLISKGVAPQNIHETSNMSHADLMSLSPAKNTLYIWEMKERNCDSEFHRDKYGINTTLVDDEKRKYLTDGLADFKELLSETETEINVEIMIVQFYSDGNVYFFKLNDYNPKWDKTIKTKRTHKKKSGSQEIVELLCHYYDLDHPRLMLHDEKVKSFYRN